jgi:hypothetical protein
MDEELAKFYSALGYSVPASGEPGELSFGTSGEGPAGSDPAELPPLGPDEIEELKRLFAQDPDVVLAWFRDTWDEDLTEEDIQEALTEASMSFDSLALATEAQDARMSFLSLAQPLPDNFTFEGMDLNEIPINPGIKRFETKGDALGWLLFSGPQLVHSTLAEKAPFRWHNHPDYLTDFVYEMAEPPAGDTLDVALFSDFGTGLYHSRYIAKQFRERQYPYAIHLGDVYYAGRGSEFREYFEEPLDPILDNTTLFTLNANHEMLSLGIPYFQYIDKRGSRDNQFQEGSYFSLRSSRFQIIGIDTDYFRGARYQEPGLWEWLHKMLTDGRAAGLTNILLTPAHPYEYGKLNLTKLLDEDLKPLVQGGNQGQALVDLWFWGNTHYCGLFDRTDELPFVGSCIGHGGYPYTKKRLGLVAPAPVRFIEARPRFPEWTGIRQDRGNNGYCLMRLGADGTIGLEYIDWMSNQRCRARLANDQEGTLLIESVAIG